MAQTVIEIGPLGDDPLEASTTFHANWLPKIRIALRDNPDNLVLMFEAGDYRHRTWRLAALQELARSGAPIRVNAIAGGADSKAALKSLEYLDAAPGVTGQLLDLHAGGEG